MSSNSKTLFITGASSGIGAQTARQAVAQGWNVGLFARSKDKLTSLSQELGDKALVLVGDAALPRLRKTTGHFLLTGSQAGRTHVRGSIYSASKWFIHGYAGNLALEMAAWGGRCTLIAPGMVDTPFFSNPGEGRLQPSDVADAVMLALEANTRNNVREIFLTPLKTPGPH